MKNPNIFLKKAMLMAVFWVIAPIFAAADSLYNCSAPDGRIIYQSMPCEGVSRITRSNLKETAPPAVVAEVKPPPTAPASVTLHAGANGGYQTMATANGYPISVIVDTGASLVSFPERMAEQVGLTCHGMIYTNTANGRVQVCTAVLDSLQIGNITLTDVDVAVMPDLSNVVLLGQSALKRLRVEQANDQITLSAIAGKTR